MIDSEKFAVKKYQKDLERWLPMTQSFLRYFVDKNILKLDQRQFILVCVHVKTRVNENVFNLAVKKEFNNS